MVLCLVILVTGMQNQRKVISTIMIRANSVVKIDCEINLTVFFPMIQVDFEFKKVPPTTKV